MKRKLSLSLSAKSFIAVAIAALMTIALTGCGFGSTDTTASVANIPSIQGVTKGGETPVAGGTVILWETDPNNTGYGQTARQIQTAVVTGANFSFTTGYSCTNANDFLYVTSTGGDVTNGSSSPIYNPNLVMMAALGSCANMATSSAQGAVHININELSTVAAAYALGNFMTVNANGGVGTQLVYIGAPANNSATTGACTGTGSAMTCASAGLAHAFANALNLVNASNAGGAGGPTGAAYAISPSNSLGSVPQALINTLGNIVQYCTNSGNSSSSSSTISSNCSALFTDAKPTNFSAPTDTLSALINIAHYPQFNIGATCSGTNGTVGGLFCLASAYPAFTPSLSAVPHDWSIGIAYSGTSQGSFGLPQYLTLDANDNVYVQTGNLHSATSTGLAAMSSSGTAIWYNAMSANYCNQGVLATDTNGNVFESINQGSTSTGCAYGIAGFSTANGASTYVFGPGSGTVCNQTSPSSINCPGFTAYDTTHPVSTDTLGLAVDHLNNLWYSREDSACATCLQEIPYSSGAYHAATTSEGASGADWNAGSELIVDATGNVYSSSVSTKLYIIPNTAPSTPSTPTYTSTSGFLSQAVGSTTFGMIALDSAGNLWSSYANNFVEFTPTLTSSVITGYTAASGSPFNTAGSAPHVGEFDGHDNLYAPSYSTGGAVYMQTSPSYSGYNATNVNAFDIIPCYAPSGASSCTVISSDPHVVQIDSTGSIWIAGTGSSGGAAADVVQVIGTAYPTWPQLSYGKFGVMPQ